MSEIDEQYIQEDNNSHDSNEQGQPYEHKDSLLEQLFAISERTEQLRRSLRGERINSKGQRVKTNEEIAGDDFINKHISAFISKVNETNVFTKKSDWECKRILHESVDAFLLAVINEETIETKDIRTLSKMYEHQLELFLGLVENGHGAKVLNAFLSGTKFNNEEPKKKDEGFLSFIRSRK
jgi:hypothetical protein